MLPKRLFENTLRPMQGGLAHEMYDEVILITKRLIFVSSLLCEPLI